MIPSTINHIYYRGYLKSCNYSCYYCPFAKNKSSLEELQKDSNALWKFYESIKINLNLNPNPNLNQNLNQNQNQNLTIMFTPYGEGMIHDYYQEIIIKLAELENVKALGIQTNLSFSAEAFINKIENLTKTKQRKIKIWSSYHPTMVTYSEFAKKANLLSEYVDISVGAVAISEEIATIQNLKSELLPHIYLWLNGESHRKNRYSENEKAIFQKIDPFFNYELSRVGSDDAICSAAKESILIEAKGKTFPCHMQKHSIGNYYKSNSDEKAFVCNRTYCDCFLAYSQLDLKALNCFFGENKRFRIPKKQAIKAIFFDIDGTIISKEGKLKQEVINTIEYLSKYCKLYFATSLSYKIAKQKCTKIWKYFSGGVFSNGSYILENHIKEEKEYYLQTNILEILSENLSIQSKNKLILDKAKDGKVLRIIIPKNKNLPPMENVNIFQDINKTYIQPIEASKKNGIAYLIKILDIDIKNILTVGNSQNDRAMLEYSGFSINMPNGDRSLDEVVDYVMDIPQIPYIVENNI